MTENEEKLFKIIDLLKKKIQNLEEDVIVLKDTINELLNELNS